MIIENSKVVGYMYDTGYQQFYGQTRDEAEKKFEAWINANTNYRGVGMYAKHKGYHFFYVTENGNKYSDDGSGWYKVDEFHNIYKIDFNEVVYEE